MKKFKLSKLLSVAYKHIWVVYLFFMGLVFIFFRDLFFSYFESDEWFHFTYYFPLTRTPDGLLTALSSTFTDAGPLSGGQHVVPVASTIYFLNTLFFGLNFVPYAFMSLLVHAINSFLVFYFVRLLVQTNYIGKKKGQFKIFRDITPFLSGIFFALSPIPMHAITGAAPFYGQNVLSVTLFLLCVICFKKAFDKKRKIFLYISATFLFLALFSKETTAFLFFLLPCIALLERRVFSFRFLAKFFIVTIVLYGLIRFIIPGIVSGGISEMIFDKYMSSAPKQVVSDTGTVVSQDISIHENIYTELFFRSVTFPVKMFGSIFLPRQTLNTTLDILTPIVYPLPGSGEELAKSQNRVFFRTGAGNDLLLYIFCLTVITLTIIILNRLYKLGEREAFKTVMIGSLVIVLSALPLVAIVLSFPRWGYDTYFDSRFYYNPNVGAAIIFPFLLFALASFFSKLIRIKNIWIAFTLFFAGWLINTIFVSHQVMQQLVYNTGLPRREIISQLRKELSALPDKTVFYIETDGLGAYGPVLPFQTSIPQALALAYYDRSPLPDSFFAKPLFKGEQQGYMLSEGKGLGYYTSKKTLSDQVAAGLFKPSDIYAFHYDSKQVRMSNITERVRAEMDEYLKQVPEEAWDKYIDDSQKLSFSYPSHFAVEESEDGFDLTSLDLNAKLSILQIPNLSLIDYQQLLDQGELSVVNLRKVVYDTYHYNEALVLVENGKRIYLMKLGDKAVQLEIHYASPEVIQIVEKILGSMEVLN